MKDVTAKFTSTSTMLYWNAIVKSFASGFPNKTGLVLWCILYTYTQNHSMLFTSLLSGHLDCRTQWRLVGNSINVAVVTSLLRRLLKWIGYDESDHGHDKPWSMRDVDGPQMEDDGHMELSA